LSERIGEYRNQAKDYEFRTRGFKKEIDVIKESLHKLKGQDGNKLAAYGGKYKNKTAVSNFIKEIEDMERQQKWRGSKPIGPFGLHVKLLNKNYNKIIHSLLHQTLNAIGVETIEDQKTLQRLMSKYNLQFTVFKYSKRRIDYKNAMPDRAYTTILDCLEINHEVVLNQLIINNSIEKTVLVFRFKARSTAIMTEIVLLEMDSLQK
jgi:structural maintenance of chromosomes protein 6